MATTSKTENVEEPTNTNKVKPGVPLQAVPESVDGDNEPETTWRDKIKNAVKKKQVIAGLSAAALLTAGVLVARKRNTSTDESEDENQTS